MDDRTSRPSVSSRSDHTAIGLEQTPDPEAADEVPDSPDLSKKPQGGFDRVGTTRFTTMGTVLLGVLILAVSGPLSTGAAKVAGPAFGVVWVALAAVQVFGVVGPMVLVRRLRVTVSAPRDAVVGETVDLTVTIQGLRAEVETRALDPTGPWRRVRPGMPVLLPHLADMRGLFHHVRVETRVTAPLGVLAAQRVHEVELPWAVEVAPRPLQVEWSPAESQAEGDADPASLAAPTGDLVRSVRPYVPGDPRHLVHWPSTARTGQLVVRELDTPAPIRQAVVLDLTDLGKETERAAAYALGACLAVLTAGGQLVVATHEAATGPVVGIVGHPVDAGRRVARAVAGPPGEAPAGWPVVEIGR
ncbi:MAG: DUF58 domain-containing protein [Aquihabitans sp.]